jgi:hypothetical protein
MPTASERGIQQPKEHRVSFSTFSFVGQAFRIAKAALQQ